MSCRDCTICTEPGIISLIMLPFRLAWFLMTFWNIRLFSRRCPQCGHRLSQHQKIGGRFVD